MFREAKREQRNPRWAVDKLIVNGKVSQVKKDKVTDINVNTTDAAIQLQEEIKNSTLKTYNHSSFQVHYIPISHQDNIVPAMYSIYSDVRVARATHNIYAYCIKHEDSATEHYEDDGEYRAGRILLNLLKENELENAFVCVSRWYGGVHLGKARFNYIIDAAKEALSSVLS